MIKINTEKYCIIKGLDTILENNIQNSIILSLTSFPDKEPKNFENLYLNKIKSKKIL